MKQDDKKKLNDGIKKYALKVIEKLNNNEFKEENQTDLFNSVFQTYQLLIAEEAQEFKKKFEEAKRVFDISLAEKDNKIKELTKDIENIKKLVKN